VSGRERGCLGWRFLVSICHGKLESAKRREGHFGAKNGGDIEGRRTTALKGSGRVRHRGNGERSTPLFHPSRLSSAAAGLSCKPCRRGRTRRFVIGSSTELARKPAACAQPTGSALVVCVAGRWVTDTLKLH